MEPSLEVATSKEKIGKTIRNVMMKLGGQMRLQVSFPNLILLQKRDKIVVAVLVAIFFAAIQK